MGADEIHVLRALCNGFLAHAQHPRLQRGHGFQPLAGLHHEQAAVPKIVAALHIGLGNFQAGLFGKALDGERMASFHCLRLLDVAVPGFRPVGDDAEGHHGTIPGELPCRFHGSVQLRGLRDDVIRRHGQQDGLRVGHQGRQGQRGGGVASARLQDQPGALHTRLLQLLRREKAVFVVAHHDGGLLGHMRCHAVQAAHRILQHGHAIAAEGQELLGVSFTRKGPQACARASAQNDREQ